MKVTESGMYEVLQNYFIKDILGKMSPDADPKNPMRLFLLRSSLKTVIQGWIAPNLAAMKLPDGSFLLPPLEDAQEGLKMAGGSLLLPINFPLEILKPFNFNVRIHDADLVKIYNSLKQHQVPDTENEAEASSSDSSRNEE